MTNLRGITSANARPEVPAPEHDAADPLSTFRQEGFELQRSLRELPAQRAAQPSSEISDDGLRLSWTKYGIWILAAVALAEAVVIGVLAYRGGAVGASSIGTLRVTSTPPGASVVVDGANRGATPLSLSVPRGEHQIGIRTAAISRNVSVNVAAGAESSQYFDLTSTVEAQRTTPDTGTLEVSSDPSGATVTVDGAARGATPLRLANLAPGTHHVVLTANGRSINRTIALQRGTATTLHVPMIEANGALSGWMRISAQVALQIYEDGRLVGTTETDRIMLAVGRHTLELTNKALGFSTRETVQITPGATSAVAIRLPRGVLSVNALPWAEVLVDGQRLGETPIANLSLPIGEHKVVFRHPQLGEQERTVSVTLLGPARVGVDLTK